MSRICATTLAAEMSETELNALRNLLNKRAFTRLHLEIGTAAGGTLCELLLATGQESQFVVVDPMTYFENQRETVERNITRHGLSTKRVDFRTAKSWDVYQKALADREVYDFILIDGAHKLRYVVQDLHWTNLLSVGGIVALHDFKPTMRGVVIAAENFLKNNANYRKLELADTLLILEKTGPDPEGGARCMPQWQAGLIQPLVQLETSIKKRLGKGR